MGDFAEQTGLGKRLVADDSASEYMLTVTDNENASGVGRSSQDGTPSTPITGEAVG